MFPINRKFLKKIKSLISLMKKGIVTQIWSIKVFSSADMITTLLNETELDMDKPSIQASDVNDAPAEFVADPFIVKEDSRFYLFFEIFNKELERGQIGLAISADGLKWEYQQVVLSENFHLSYPQVFKVEDEMFMLPETIETNRVLLYKAKQFPNQWEVACELLDGNFMDPSIIKYDNKWWIFAGTEGGNLHLFHSEQLEGPYFVHPQSPIITSNLMISRPGGRFIFSDGTIYRYTQADYPHYGDSVRVFKVNKLTEFEYEEEEISLILCGTKKEGDWRKDGMHHIDQLMIDDNQWLVAVDGHSTQKSNYFVWKLSRLKSKFLVKTNRSMIMMKRFFDLLISIPLLLLFSPVIGIVAVLVRAKLGSPIIFTQLRPGLHGKPINIYKFRTMTDARDNEGNLLPDSIRLTSFGEFLRKYSLDELLQLVNVIKGDLSLVGPRPLLMDYLTLYTEEQAKRHQVRPGITGWAQVNGRNAISWEEKFRLDVWYVENQSLLLDFKILALTFVKVIKSDGISHGNHVTMEKFSGSNLS